MPTRTETIAGPKVAANELVTNYEYKDGLMVYTITSGIKGEVEEEEADESYQRGDFMKTVRRLRKKYGPLQSVLEDDPDPRVQAILERRRR